MLTTSEKERFFKFFQLCSLFWPLNVDCNKKIVTARVHWCKRVFCWLSYATFVLHVALKDSRLAYVLLFEEGTPILYLIIHMVLAFAGLMLAFWYYVMFIRYPQEQAMIVKKIWLCRTTSDSNGVEAEAAVVRSDVTVVESEVSEEQSVAVEASKEPGKRETEKRRWMTYTLQDTVVVYSHCAIAVAAILIWVAQFCFPDMTVNLYSGLPSPYRTSAGFALLCIEEARYIVTMYCIAVPIFQLHVIVIGDISEALRDLADSIMQRCNYSLNQAHEDLLTLKHLQLHVVLVNTVHRYIIFSLKQFAIIVCITSGYAAIAHFHDHVIFGAMYFTMFIELALIYVILYDRAFSVPGLFESVTKRMLMMMRVSNPPIRSRKVLEKQVRGIPRMGIKVGDFHTLERTSTPTFVDYVVNNVVSMLVAYG